MIKNEAEKTQSVALNVELHQAPQGTKVVDGVERANLVPQKINFGCAEFGLTSKKIVKHSGNMAVDISEIPQELQKQIPTVYKWLVDLFEWKKGEVNND